MRMNNIFAVVVATAVCAMPMLANAQDMVTEETIQNAKQDATEDALATLVVPLNVSREVSCSISDMDWYGSETQSDINLLVSITGQYEIQIFQEPRQLSVSGELHVESSATPDWETIPETDFVFAVNALPSEDGNTIDTYTSLGDGDTGSPAWVYRQENVENDASSILGDDELWQFNFKTMEALIPEGDLRYELTDKGAYDLSDGGLDWDFALQLALEELIPHSWSNIRLLIERQGNAFSDDDKEIFSQMAIALAPALFGCDHGYAGYILDARILYMAAQAVADNAYGEGVSGIGLDGVLKGTDAAGDYAEIKRLSDIAEVISIDVNNAGVEDTADPIDPLDQETFVIREMQVVYISGGMTVTATLRDGSWNIETKERKG